MEKQDLQLDREIFALLEQLGCSYRLHAGIVTVTTSERASEVLVLVPGADDVVESPDTT